MLAERLASSAASTNGKWRRQRYEQDMVKAVVHYAEPATFEFKEQLGGFDGEALAMEDPPEDLGAGERPLSEPQTKPSCK